MINLREQRLNRGLGIRAAAKAIGVARGTLERAEAGDDIHVASKKKIADFYGHLVTELWPLDATDSTRAAA